MTLTLPAPAKLNLFLHITGRQADGFHSLQTLFALLDHGDTLHFRPAQTLSLTCRHPEVPNGDGNLILKAARELQAHTGTQAGAAIQLDKRLPLGGGVGGGSSNAATALLGLNRLWGLNLNLSTLAHLGIKLGADVPVFVHGHSALAEGVGEQLTPLTLPEQHYLVVHPGVHVSTAGIFSDQQLTRDSPASRLPLSLDEVSNDTSRNDCEAVAKRLFPEIGATLQWLKRHTGNSRMTGTGACCFSRLTDPQQGQHLLTLLPENWTGFIARSVNTSPLHGALAI